MTAQIDRAMIARRPQKILGRLAAWSLIEGRPLLTRGRWINPLVYSLYALAQATPLRARSDEPIYIVGTGRSGTTILGKLFAMHRETVFLNEPKSAWHYVRDDEDLIGSYSRGPARVRLGRADASPEMAAKLARIYSWAMRWGMASRVVDKYPELIFRIPFVLQLFPRARFVAIVRDGVDTCASVVGWSRRKGETRSGEIHDWWGRDGRKWRLLVDQIVPEHPDLAPLQDKLRQTSDHFDRAAVEWILSMREARGAGDAWPEQVLNVRYEDLCADPATILPRITAHCGLSDDPVFTNYARSVLSAAQAHGGLRLMPELLLPFRETLVTMGYAGSRDRVQARE